jgi:hypothetical protein
MWVFRMCVYKWISHFFGWQMTKHHTKGWLKNSVGSFYMYACELFLYAYCICLIWGNSYNWIWHFAQYMNYITLEGRLQISVDSFLMYICKLLYVYLTWGTHTIWVQNHLQLETEDSCSCWIGLLFEENPIYIKSATPFLNVTQPALGHPQAPSLSKTETNPGNSLFSCPHWHTIHSIAMLWLETGTKLVR